MGPWHHVRVTGPLPPYPPHEDAWRFAAPPLRRRWAVAAWSACIGSMVVALALAASIVVLASRDLPGVLDDDRVLEKVEHECELMAVYVDQIRVAGTREERAEAIRDQNAAVVTMTKAIRRLGPEVRAGDAPLEGWLADWDRLVTARETYASALEAGTPAELVVPTATDGTSVDVRMDRVADSVCTVPATLLDPDRGDLTDI